MKFSKEFYLKTLSWAVLLLSILCSFSVFTPHTHAWLTCSDAVSIQFIYDDFIVGPGKLKDWYFPAAPSPLPDLTLYSIVQLFHFKFLISIIFYALFQMMIISLLCIYIFKKTAPERLRSYSWLIPCLYSIIFLEAYYFTKDITMNQLLTSCYYHAGPFVNCLIVYAVFLSTWKNLFKYIFFFVFSLLSAFSDMLFIVMLTGPFILTVLFTITRTDLKRNVFFVFCIAAGSFAGIKIHHYLKDHGITYFYNPEKMYAFSDILPSLKIYTEQMVTYIMAPGFRSFHMLFTFLSLPVAALLLIFKRRSLSKEMNFFLKFMLLFSSAVLSAPIINGNYIGYDTWRYNVAIFYISIITLAFFTAYIIEFKINKPKIKHVVSLTFVLLLLALIFVKFSPSGLKRYSNFYPDRAREIDSLSDKYQLKKGISMQGHSKFITMFSKKNLEVLAVHSNACIAEMGSNINWYYDKDFDFIIISDGMSMDFAKTFKIRDTCYTKDFTILRVEKFHYPKGTYAPVTK